MILSELLVVLSGSLWPLCIVAGSVYMPHLKWNISLCLVFHSPLYPQSSRLSKKDKRVVYTVLEYSPLLDSCNMTMDDWAMIGKDIEVLGLSRFYL